MREQVRNERIIELIVREILIGREEKRQRGYNISF